MNNEIKIINNDFIVIDEKKENKEKKLDSFFDSFEQIQLNPVIFKRPEEGEECINCSG